MAPATCLPLPGTPTLLRQALGNLLDNAARYAPQSEVAASLAAQTVIATPYAVLSVRDGGPGLSAEALTRVLQPFCRAPGVQVAGSSLGLSVVEQIAKAHGGRLDLRNRLPQGLEVQLWLLLELAEQELGAGEVGSLGTAVPEPESAAE